MNRGFLEKLACCMPEGQIRTDEPMADHTTFRLGGAADFFVLPQKAEEVQAVVKLCRREGMPYYIIGNGSNLLVSDRGYRGTVICICDGMNEICAEGEYIRAQAGALMSEIASAALENSLTGFEFASGIPGTIGGAAVMNAGAYGGEMKDVIVGVTVLDEKDEIRQLTQSELEFGYRTSAVMKHGYTVLGAVLKLKKGEQEKIKAEMDELASRRTAKQPLEYPSAGSTFKRPEGYFAGKLIQDTGLSGYRIGGAQVSVKHSGFVINTGNATAEDVDNLMRAVSDKVYEKFGVRLEPEVRKLGEF